MLVVESMLMCMGIELCCRWLQCTCSGMAGIVCLVCRNCEQCWGVSNRWTGIWNGTMEWKMEWNSEHTQLQLTS